MNWQWRRFDELSLNELYDILYLREKVFMIEQNCQEPDLDHKDQIAMHLLGLNQNKLVAYLRLFLPDTKYPGASSFGRIVTPASERGKGLGKQAVEHALTYLKRDHSSFAIIISAQLYLQKFYEGFRFVAIGEPYDEAGILHIAMRREPE